MLRNGGNDGYESDDANSEDDEFLVNDEFADSDSDDDDDDDFVHRLTTSIPFSQIYEAVRRNDAGTTEVDIDPRSTPGNYGVPLGEALQGNTHVANLLLYVDGYLNHGHVQEVAALLSFIQTAPALRVLSLHSEDEPDQPTFHAILAAATTSTYLDELNLIPELDPIQSLDAFCTMVQHSRSIRRLSFWSGQESDRAAWDRVAAVLGLNRTLTALTIYPSHYPAFLNSVFMHQSTNPVLKELYIITEDDHGVFDLGCARMLLQSPTSQLSTLQLGGCLLDQPMMNELIAGLRSNCTLEKLAFYRCQYDTAAVLRFLEYGSNEFHAGCQLRELSFNPSGSVDSDFIIQLLRLNKSGTLDDTGTSFPQKLNLDLCMYGGVALGAIFYHVSSRASEVRLPHLAFGTMGGDEWHCLALYLPSALYLRELTVTSDQFRPLRMRPLLRGLRCNGSLWHVHLPPGDASLTPRQARLMQAYLARNVYVAQAWRMNPAGACRDNEMRLLFATVAQTLRCVTQMAPNMILTGLLAFDDADCVGPYSMAL